MFGVELDRTEYVVMMADRCSTTDSRVYIWRRQTGLLVAALDAHTPGTVNAVAWHPTNPAVFASAGDDRRVRV